MVTQSYVRQDELTAAEIGVNDASMNAIVTGSWIDMVGYNELALVLDHTNSAATAMTFYFDSTDDGGTTVARMQASAIASGVETLSNLQVSKAVSGDATWDYAIKVRADQVRIVVEVATGADANDKLTITGQRRVVPA